MIEFVKKLNGRIHVLKSRGENLPDGFTGHFITTWRRWRYQCQIKALLRSHGVIIKNKMSLWNKGKGRSYLKS